MRAGTTKRGSSAVTTQDRLGATIKKKTPQKAAEELPSNVKNQAC